MKKLIKLTAILIISMVLICGISFLTDRSNYAKWITNTINPKPNEISWAKFIWGNDSLNGKFYARAFMLIPCKIEGLPYDFTFQFDLGAGIGGIYENNLKNFYGSFPDLRARVRRFKSPLQFWNKNKVISDIGIVFGNYRSASSACYVLGDYGYTFNIDNPKDTFSIGTIGADLFQNKVLIIDYPKQQFAICDTIPAEFKCLLTDITLDRAGRVVLPMKIRNHDYRILFDNGSSLFPLITLAKNINYYSNSPDLDTISIFSWGKHHEVTGKMITDSFELGGQKFAHVKVYSNHSGYGADPDTDGMAGNALFWDKTMIIDFKNRKFGIK